MTLDDLTSELSGYLLNNSDSKVQILCGNDHRDPGGSFDIEEIIYDNATDCVYITFGKD